MQLFWSILSLKVLSQKSILKVKSILCEWHLAVKLNTYPCLESRPLLGPTGVDGAE